MAIGIERIAEKASADDIIICFNNDIEIPDQILTRIISQVRKQPKLVISPLSVSPHSDRVVATGVNVKNWWLGINETPFNGLNYKTIANSELKIEELLKLIIDDSPALMALSIILSKIQ